MLKSLFSSIVCLFLPFGHIYAQDSETRNLVYEQYDACLDDYNSSCTRLIIPLARGEFGLRQIDMALTLADVGCDENEAEACVQGGYILAGYRISPLSGSETALESIQTCAKGDQIACSKAYNYNFMRPLELEGSRRADYKEAREFIQRACVLDSEEGCAVYAQFQYDGFGGPLDIPGARVSIRKACSGYLEPPLPDFCDLLSNFTSRTDKEVEDARLGEMLREQIAFCVDDRKAVACSYAGGAYLNARGATKDIELGLSYLSKSCDLGGLVGCRMSAVNYFQNQEVPQDIYKTLRFLRRACILNDKAACGERLSLARMHPDIAAHEEESYSIEDAVAYAEAIQKATHPAALAVLELCEVGDLESCLKYARFEIEGTYNVAIKAEDGEAKMMLLCEEGLANACAEIAERIEKDLMLNDQLKGQSVKFYAKACELGSTFSCLNVP